ncbi:prephenate dehydrogenase/arogenate dehydrogenase family protein [Candidatus Poribacteria bacterium]|nr:prephenate dehydrogenase/arogenate dehydrogenase family protein [Candidatus Poribacteria bacterium]MYB00696.1 prephenate dehydrogenase/arogenate dehydrogenase family protein [Candidatus Poribacteria bacterium]
MEQIQQLRRITIWGVGLIGGSLGLALKKNGFQGQRLGLGRNIGRLEDALERDAVDVITTELAEGLRETDLLVLCTPVALVPRLVQRIIESVDTRQHRIVLTDVGSTKSTLVETIETQLQEQRADALSFIGGHPMAGSHETGVAAARATLFQKATCILTPTPNTDADALALIKNLWEFVGAVPHLLSPKTHDLLIGAASHLPHLVASLLTNTVANVETEDGKALDFTATGFRDSTRIAAGSPDLWTDIFTENRDVLVSLIDDIVENLTAFKTLLQTDNLVEIERLLLKAQGIVKKQREKLGGA